MAETSHEKIIWANLIHLSFNMWFDCPRNVFKGKRCDGLAQPYLRFDGRLWDDLLAQMAKAGMNMVVLDLGDGIRYRSHPEIAVENAWTPKRLKQELAKMRTHGLEPIPKLNFAAAHDNWLGPYARMLSTETYYRVCRDLIAEVSELFGAPRFFHLGMDEETAVNQIYNQLVVIRQFDLFWHDLDLMFSAVRQCGARPWVWSDYQWYHPEQFFRRMPKDVLQSNWWYSRLRPETVLTRVNPQVMDTGKANMTEPLRLKPVKAYLELEKHGYDQVPAGGTHSLDTNFANTAAFARRHISPKHLYGFLQTTWCPTIEHYRDRHIQAVDLAAAAIKQWPRQAAGKSPRNHP